jgi:hypothetical protein
MAFRSKKSFRSGKSKANDKYIRLTGLWQSKNNEDLYTGKAKEEQIEKLIEAATEALESGAPLVFSLWVNNEKDSRKDPEFSLQTFIGDAEEKPRERGFKRKERDEEADDTASDDVEATDSEDEEEEAEEPKRKQAGKTSKKAKRSSGW